MKEPKYKSVAAWLSVLLTLAVISAKADAQEMRDGKENPLIGPITLQQLFDLKGWFGQDFVRYTPNRSYTLLLKEYLEGVTIKCFLGTWCEDSEIQVPRMLKVLQQGGVDPNQFEMYGLDADKDSPANVENAYSIERVPTFILVYQDREIGRIVEEPIGTLEKDLVGLIMKAFPEKYPFYEENKPEEPQPGTDASGDDGSDSGEKVSPHDRER